MGLGYGSQPLGHTLAGKVAWNTAGAFADKEWPQVKPFLQPMAAVGSHIVMDRLIGEAYLGDYQMDIGLVRVLIGYFLTPEGKDRDEYMQYAFWALLPDIGEKVLGQKWMHPELSGPKVFQLSRDNNELLEELFLASLIFKWEVKF
jgi:hypothetical protein